MAEIIPLQGKSYFEEVLDELIEFNKKGLVTDKDAGVMCRYWFGETSSIFCLGLWSNMRHIIECYINGEDLLKGD